MKYGRTLLSKLPDETTQLLVDVCSGVKELDGSPAGPALASTGAHARSPTANSGLPYLSLLNLNRTNAVQPAADETTSPDEKAPDGAASAEKVQGGLAHTRSDSVDTTAGVDSSILQAQQRQRIPRPSQYFAHFVDHRAHFIRFLEAVANNRWGQRVPPDQRQSTLASSSRSKPSDPDERDDQIAIWNTLLELYLSAALDSAVSGDENAENEVLLKERAMHVLGNEASLPYDPTHALIVCSTHSFTDGLVLLWEKMGMYEEVLRFWMDQELHPEIAVSISSTTAASTHVVRCLDLYGPQHPHLYPLVLRFLSSSPALLSRHTDDLKRLLEVVNREGYMAPLGVVQILSRNDVASVGLVKEWLMSRITESREGIEAVRLLTTLSWVSYSCLHDRTASSSARTVTRHSPSSRRSPSYPILNSQKFSTLRAAWCAGDRWICLLCISCVITATITGTFLSLHFVVVGSDPPLS